MAAIVLLLLALALGPAGAGAASPAGGGRLTGAAAPAASCATAGYAVQRFDLHPLPWAELYPGRSVTSYAAAAPVDATGLPMRQWSDGLLYYAPSTLTFDALRRLNAYVRTGDRAYLDLVLATTAKLRELSVVVGDQIWLPIPYDHLEMGLDAPWYNALAQGTALALFSRLHRLLGDPADLAFARGLFNSLAHLRDGADPWVGWVDRDGYLWYEHFAAGSRGKVLNAHIYATIGLRDYWQEDPRPRTRCVLEGAITTLRARAERFRRPGTFSWYSLRPRVAYVNYHRFHVQQLRAMADASGDPWFDALAQRFVLDYWPPGWRVS